MSMRRYLRTVTGVIAAAVLYSGIAGCVVAADAVNPNLIYQLGGNPAALKAQGGKIIIAFSNETSSPATFYAYTAVDATDLTQGINNLSVGVEPQDIGNSVFDCPLDRVGLKNVDNGTVTTVAAVITTATAQVSVDYTGIPLDAPSNLQCGDLIVVHLVSTGGDTFAIFVEVQPAK